MKFATKPTHHPSELYACCNTTLANTKFKCSANIQQICKKNRFFVIHPQLLIFLVFSIASFSLYWLQIKFFMPLFFYLFTFAINYCWF